MSITVSYTGSIGEFREALEQANGILQSEEFFALIASRETPFEESVPSDLSPATVADVFRNSNLSLTLTEYATGRTVGGKFNTGKPKNVYLNTNAVHRGACVLSCVLVHECVHALSFDSRDCNFSHDEDEREANLETAPYWIQSQLLEQQCPSLTQEDVLLVELTNDSEDE